MDDLLAYLIGVLEVPDTAGHTFDVGGPETLTYAEMIRQFAGVVGANVALLYRAGRPDFSYYSRRAGGTASCAAPTGVA